MYRLILLGGIDLLGPKGPLSGRIVRPRPLALLALLARSSGTPLTREKAVGLLWPEVSESRARRRLSDALYSIRRELGDAAVESIADRLRLDAGIVRSDVDDFEEAVRASRLAEAAGLYEGPFLDGFHLGGEGEFDRWTEGERRRLALAHRDILERLAEEAEREREWPAAVAWWTKRAAEEPTDSRVAARLIEALHASGNAPKALAHAREHARLVREELGVGVPEEVRSLVDAISDGILERLPDRSPRGAASPIARRPGGDPPQPEPAPAPASPPRRAGGRHWGSFVRAALLLLVTVGAATLLLPWGEPEDRDAAPAPAAASSFAEASSIVVLPFETLGSLEYGHFAEGITEELTVRLASVSGLDVIARRTADQLDAGDDARDLGAELGVAYALAGTVRWEERPGEEDRIRIAPRLVRLSDGMQVWGDTYDREAAELFALQSEIARRVVEQLRLALAEEDAETGARPTRDLAAYHHFLQGNAYLSRQFAENGVRAAVDQYERALERDPDFTGAWRRLIHARLWLAWVLGDEEEGLRARDDVAALEELDPDDPEVRLARAWFFYYGERRYAAALEELEAVLERRPGDGEVLRVAGFLQLRAGRWDEALSTLRTALELSPRDAELAFSIGQALRALGRFEEALKYYDRAFSLAPEEDVAFLLSSREHALLALGDTSGAREARELARAHGATPWASGRAELYDGDPAEAARRIRDDAAGSRLGRLFRYDNLADLHARMGDETGRRIYADSLLHLAEEVAPEAWDRPRPQEANVGWIFAGLALIHLGEPDEGLRHVRRGLELEAPFDDALVLPNVQAWAARAFVRAGHSEEAIELLEEVRSLPGVLSDWDLLHDPEWDPVREDPRFRALLP